LGDLGIRRTFKPQCPRLKTVEEWLEKSKEAAPEKMNRNIYRDSLIEIGYMGEKNKLMLPK
jgi:hypothetical protein